MTLIGIAVLVPVLLAGGVMLITLIDLNIWIRK